MKKSKALLIVAIVVVVLVGVVVIRSALKATDISYGPYPIQKFDFYAPKKSSDTLLIVVHGGAWIGGDKGYMADSARFFSQQGVSVINMNYRLAPNWKYDTQLKDIALVIKYAAEHQAKFKLKENYKIMLLGHSAGSHLCAQYALKESEYGTQNIDGSINLTGSFDLETAKENTLRGLVYDAFLGNTSRAEASPVNNIKQGDKTKFLLIVGSQDELVGPEQVHGFESALQEKNVYVESWVVDGETHNSIVDKIPENGSIAQRIVSLINSV